MPAHRRRIVAFHVSTQPADSPAARRAAAHWAQLADEFGLECRHCHLGPVTIGWMGVALGDCPARSTQTLELVIGPHAEQLDSALTQHDPALIRDRYLRVHVTPSQVSVTCDYAGTVPLYYSRRHHLSLSNVQPMVVLDSHASADDLSYANVFGFLKFSHFIWDETAFTHIYAQEPDSRFEFGVTTREIRKIPLHTLQATGTRAHCSLAQVADDFNDLNTSLVRTAFAATDEVALPLSSGYDSRLILAALRGQPHPRVQTFSYGPEGAIDVEAARRLAHHAGVDWHRLDLHCDFLDARFLRKVSLTMGGALHYHGMYQFAVFEQALRSVSPQTVLTSGFMTGVPAGQHISLMDIADHEARLSDAMGCFGQSRIWSTAEICALSPHFEAGMIDQAEAQFRKAYQRFDGEPFQRSVVFDIWTRQRQFISYYPRTFEWVLPTISPHMTPGYQNFFLSLSYEHLRDRKAVEAMLIRHHRPLAGVASNSNRCRSLTRPLDRWGFGASYVLRRLGLSQLVPAYYRNAPITFDVDAVRQRGLKGLAPLFAGPSPLADWISEETVSTLGQRMMQEVKNPTCTESQNYLKLVTLQALATDAGRTHAR